MSTQEKTLVPPRHVGGYELLQEVGKGGMGSVYQARAADGRIVAVKVLAAHLVNNDVQRARFYQEARSAMQVDHPNIVRAIEVGEDGGRHFFAMEFVDGESLGTRLKRVRKVPEPDARRIIAGVAEALREAHRLGLIHRDVKPDNILLSSDDQIKLADMGLVKTTEADLGLTKTGRGLGTPHFMAPEQFKDAKSVTKVCDIYSLGATLYQMVTGEMPFRGSTPLDAFVKKSKNEYPPPEQYTPTLSESTLLAISRAMDANPGNRPADAQAFLDILHGKARPGAPPPVEESVSGVRLLDREPLSIADNIWYVIWTEPSGEQLKVKGTLTAIARKVAKSRIPMEATVSPTKTGPFLPLLEIPEFADALTRQMARMEDDPDSMILSNSSKSELGPRSGRIPGGAKRPVRPAVEIEDDMPGWVMPAVVTGGVVLVLGGLLLAYFWMR